MVYGMDEKKLLLEAKERAIDVLKRNSKGRYHSLPKTAGDGYPEPYTRDLLLCSLGICRTDDIDLLMSLEKVLVTLAKNQSEKGHIPSLVHDPLDRGASDTTPLFLLALDEFRKKTKLKNFLEDAAEKALIWLSYQSPDDNVMIAQLPTSDWRDEEWVLGYGLYVNAIYYEVLKRFRKNKEMKILKSLISRFDIASGEKQRHIHEGLTIKKKPYFAQWAYKVMASERFDLVGNSFAIVFGLASKTRASKIIKYVEEECERLRERKELKGELPPVLFPYIKRGDPDWHERYEIYNNPGCYHNGGVWPFACGLYVVAITKTRKIDLALRKLIHLALLNKVTLNEKFEWGFKEWFRAYDLKPMGTHHQSWSAAMYLYAFYELQKFVKW